MAHESLAGKTALVTGAAVRIGRAIALALAQEGVNVVVHYRHSTAEAEALLAELRARGVQAWGVTADFAVRAEYESLLDRAVEVGGEVDFLVNSASIFPASTLPDLTFEDLSHQLEVNAWVPFWLTRALAQRGGPRKVVNLLDARLGGDDPGHVAYLFSKQLLAQLTRQCALAFAPEVTVNAVAPGLILPPAGKEMRYVEALAHTVPLLRHGDPADVAEAVLYLLRSNFLTGEIIYLDGGKHLL
jgi:pteridine reductase